MQIVRSWNVKLTHETKLLKSAEGDSKKWHKFKKQIHNNKNKKLPDQIYYILTL